MSAWCVYVHAHLCACACVLKVISQSCALAWQDTGLPCLRYHSNQVTPISVTYKRMDLSFSPSSAYDCQDTFPWYIPQSWQQKRVTGFLYVCQLKDLTITCIISVTLTSTTNCLSLQTRWQNNNKTKQKQTENNLPNCPMNNKKAVVEKDNPVLKTLDNIVRSNNNTVTDT